MKKTSKKLTAKDREGSDKWIGLLEATYMFHMQMAKETQSPLLGAGPNKENLFHRACAQAVQDCIYLIEMAKLEGWFEDEDDISQFREGPAG